MLVLYYFIILKPGKLNFWKWVARNPDEALDFFQNKDCWVIFYKEPIEGYKSALPVGNWDGPFRICVPKLGGIVVVIYGRSPDYINDQDTFMKTK